MVCPRCGLVDTKQLLEATNPLSPSTGSASRAHLGSYMGTMRITPEERGSRGVSGSNSKYEYLKVLSDYAGRDDGPADACDRIIARVVEKLFLPKVVHEEASAVAKTLLASDRHGRRVTLAVVSAFALVRACQVGGVTSVSVREIIAAHAALGRRLNSSSFIQLALESPIKILPRRPDEYVSRILARLSSDQRLADRLKSDGASQTRYFNALRDGAKELIQAVSPEELSGRRPCALAAAAVYSAELALSFHERRRKRLTQRLLAECGDAAEYTIREQCATIFTPAAARLHPRTQEAPLLASAG